MTTTAPPQSLRQSTPLAARLTVIAGWSLLVIAVAHIAAFAFIVPWGDWFAGSLRSGEADLGSVADFWALPGGIVLPTVLTGLLMIRLGRQGQRLGIGFGIALIVWAGFCVFLLGPSGFLGVLVPAGFLIAAAVVDRKA